MELQRFQGRSPSFAFDKFRKVRDAYDSGIRQEWVDRQDIRRFVATLDEGSVGRIVGHISAETAQRWLDWKFGELYVFGWHRGYLLCIREGVVLYG
jgi:hypothetical protein